MGGAIGFQIERVAYRTGGKRLALRLEREQGSRMATNLSRLLGKER